MASMEPKRVLKPVNTSQITSAAEQQLSHLKKMREDTGTAPVKSTQPPASAPPAGRSGNAAAVDTASGTMPKMWVF